MVAVILAVLVTSAAASAESEIARGVQWYDEGEFTKAKDVLLAQLEKTLPAGLEARARIHLAASYFALNDTASARAQLLSLFKKDLAAQLDEAKFAPRLMVLAEAARRDAERALGASRPKPVEPETPGGTSPRAGPVVSAPGPAAGPSALSASLFVPFGVGQFANGHSGKGTFFLLAEALCFATSAVSLATLESMKQDGTAFQTGRFTSQDIGTARLIHSIYLGAFYVGAAVLIGGILDAVLTRPLGSEQTGVSIRHGVLSFDFL